MLFKEIILTQFKNYTFNTFKFDKRIVGICGPNGKGKTNLLDAIYYLCFTKSYFSRSDQLNIQFDKDGFRLESKVHLSDDTDQKILCIYKGNKKEFSLNGVSYEKFSGHIGKFPAVFIAPDDISLINNSSDERRRFLDMLISQIDSEYLQNLILYNKLLAQRNGLLKYEAIHKTRDSVLLSSIDERMIPAGTKIFHKRRNFCQSLFPKIHELYQTISGTDEAIAIEYKSSLIEQDFAALLKNTLYSDRQARRTNEGIHKDDIVFSLKDNPFKKIASQGQKKSLLFACKLAEFNIIKREKGFAPLLLLDDIFEKLDEQRVHNLLRFIIEENEGQVFITDTHRQRLSDVLKQFSDNLQLLTLD